MYARVTSFKVDPARRDELALKVEAMAPRAKALPGMIDAYVGWRDDGQGVLVARLSRARRRPMRRRPGSRRFGATWRAC